jgi:hypothetical protein
MNHHTSPSAPIPYEQPMPGDDAWVISVNPAAAAIDHGPKLWDVVHVLRFANRDEMRVLRTLLPTLFTLDATWVCLQNFPGLLVKRNALMKIRTPTTHYAEQCGENIYLDAPF